MQWEISPASGPIHRVGMISMKAKIIIMSLSLTISIMCTIAILRNDSFPILLSYLFFILAYLCCLSLAILLISEISNSIRVQKHLPAIESFLSRPNYYTFKYLNLSSLEDILRKDSYMSSYIETCMGKIKLFRKESVKKSKLNFQWKEVSNILFIEAASEVVLRNNMKEVNCIRKKTFQKKEMAEDNYTVLLIIGTHIPLKEIRKMIKIANFMSPCYITVVLDINQKKLYHPNMPDKKRTQPLHIMIDTYFS